MAFSGKAEQINSRTRLVGLCAFSPKARLLQTYICVFYTTVISSFSCFFVSYLATPSPDGVLLVLDRPRQPSNHVTHV